MSLSMSDAGRMIGYYDYPPMQEFAGESRTGKPIYRLVDRATGEVKGYRIGFGPPPQMRGPRSHEWTESIL